MGVVRDVSLNDKTVLFHAGALRRATNLSQRTRVTRDAVFSRTRYNLSVARLVDGLKASGDLDWSTAW